MRTDAVVGDFDDSAVRAQRVSSVRGIQHFDDCDGIDGCVAETVMEVVMQANVETCEMEFWLCWRWVMHSHSVFDAILCFRGND